MLLPMCAMCGHPVDRLTAMPQRGLAQIFVVECHGDMESTLIYLSQVQDADLRPGVAFENTKPA